MGEIKAETVNSVEEIGSSRWNDVVERSRTQTILYSYDFIRAIEEGFEGQPRHTVVKKDGNLLGVMPCYYRNMDFPGLGYLTSYHGRGGPVIASSEEEVLRGMIENSISIARETGAMFQDISSPTLEAFRYNSMFLDNSYNPNTAITRKVIDLNRPIGQLKAGMKNRSKRKRFEEFKDAEVDILRPGRQELIEFYRLHKRYQDRAEVMNKTIDFFTCLEGLEDNVIIARAYNGSEIAGEHLYLIDEARSVLHHLATGMGEGYREINATERIHAKMIRWAKNEGFSSYDFGKNSGDFRKGVFKFKDEYGAENRPVISWRRVFKKPRYKAYRFATRVS